ncbi:GAF domain-containing protein [uncultured Sphingomonas sp.]|uniref:GAF domain-containing protein n=1 Tax=uncultured Sphingomonas sp. TaxID=158754 RepID=UPI0025D3A0F8|nr:GAF domain-containing protein [uncultured Sphingomonas sp.]
MLTNLFRERLRSRAVRGLTGGDEASASALDRHVEAAQQGFAAPIAALSLIYDDIQAIHAARGVDVGCLPRRDGFCTLTLDASDVLECCDATVDPRFATLPSVTGEPFIRYYIGTPLRLIDGIEIGALCVADIKPRPPASADQKAYLVGLARQVSLVMEGRRGARGVRAA